VDFQQVQVRVVATNAPAGDLLEMSLLAQLPDFLVDFAVGRIDGHS